MLDVPPVRQAGLPAGTGDEVLRLGRSGRGWRLVVVLGLVVAYVTGSLVGQDDSWPFGPWRMFATATPPTGNVTVLALQVTTADGPAWQDSALAPGSIGLNRAEVEGRQPQLRSDPLLLRTLAVSHARLHPADAAGSRRRCCFWCPSAGDAGWSGRGTSSTPRRTARSRSPSGRIWCWCWRSCRWRTTPTGWPPGGEGGLFAHRG